MLGGRAGVGETTLVEPRRCQSGPPLRRVPHRGHSMLEGLGRFLWPTLGPEYLAQLRIVTGRGPARAACQGNRGLERGDRLLRVPCRGQLNAESLVSRGV